MIYFVLFWEFFKIGLLAVGGGLVTVPFLYDLSSNYPWFTPQELTDMIAVSESTPGPIGVNMATYAGFKATGIMGGIVATLGLLTPSMIIILLLAHYLKAYDHNLKFEALLRNIRPVSLALIAFGGIFIARALIDDYVTAGLTVLVFAVIHFVKLNPILYICLGIIGGVLFA
ncbi:MAG: chromate transporter [Alphaproteobacteria bacterium]|nr:chromate transporter [Alphaproteobacteria bacterium]